MIVQCEKCNTEFDNFSKWGIKRFCSKKCANSRGERTADFKKKVSATLSGRTRSQETTLRGILTKGQQATALLPNTVCIVCGCDTGTKHRKTCSDDCFRINCSISSQLNPNCGGQKHTHRTQIKNIEGGEFVAESSYEVRVAESLNANNILWVRPSSMTYVDSNGRTRRYHPDFYLPQYDVYLDPKNDYLIKTDINKITKAARENSVKIIILGEQYLEFATYAHLVGRDGTAPPYPPCKGSVLLLN